MDSDLYYKKYLKYKSKYVELKKLYGGEIECENNIQNDTCDKLRLKCGSNDTKKCVILHNLGFSEYYIGVGANLEDEKFNTLIQLKQDDFNDYSSYNGALNYKTLDNNKIEQMNKLKNIGFTEDIPYDAVYKLSEEQIEKMIFIKKKGFTDKFAYSYVKGDDNIRKNIEFANNKKRFKNIPIKQFNDIKKEEKMLELKEQGKSDQDAYQEAYLGALNYNPLTQ